MSDLVCQLGCTQCSDGTGDCTACESGFTQDANDHTKCIPVSSPTSGTGSTSTPCPDGSFGSNGLNCTLCSSTCKTCSGPTSSDCIICGAGQYTFNGQCVGTNANGVCSGTNLVANNDKNECDSTQFDISPGTYIFNCHLGCPAKCTTCNIPNFSAASTFGQIQCTGCIPGSVLSQGKCVAQCPSGTFLASDNLTCTREFNPGLFVINTKFCWQHVTPRARAVSVTPNSV